MCLLILLTLMVVDLGYDEFIVNDIRAYIGGNFLREKIYDVLLGSKGVTDLAPHKFPFGVLI